MKNKTLIGGIVVVLLIIAGAWWAQSTNQQPAPAEDNKIVIAGTMFPIFDIAKNVTPDNVTVKQVLPSGTSPHTFEATPATIADLQDVDVFYAIGHELDNWIVDITKNIGADVVVVDTNIPLQEFEEDHDEHEDEHKDEHHDDHDDHADEDHHEEADHHDHHHEGVDPHYWLDPENGIIISQTIAEDLQERFPSIAEEVKSNQATFAKELEAKNVEWLQKVSTLQNKDIVTFHNAFGYFADHFGLNVIATFEPFPGKEPTPNYLKELQDQITEENITSLYIEPQLSTESITAFAKDLNVQLGTLDPIGGGEDIDSYINLIEYNVNTILEKQ